MSTRKLANVSVQQKPGEVLEIRGAKHFSDKEEVLETSIFCRDGFLLDPKDPACAKPAEVVEAKGLYLFPGLVDLHVHFREPGQEYKEDIASGTRAAVAGGVTACVTMPNTKPVADQASVIAFMQKRAEESAVARVYPAGSVSKGLRGAELSEMGLMAEQGIVAVTDDGKAVANSDLLRKGMDYAKRFDLMVMDHCEDPDLKGVMNEGVMSWKLGLAGQATPAEAIIVARDILMAEFLDLPIYLQHISSEQSVALIREAKARGVKVYAETCPHYFSLTEEACAGYNTAAKVNPPLKLEEDRLAICEALQDGTLDVISTDHAPHEDDAKDLPFAQAANGLIGLETSLALGYTNLVKKGYLTLFELVEKMSTIPAEILRLPHGRLDPGMPADFCLFDPEETWAWTAENRASKSRNTAFAGMPLQGRVKATWVAGKKVYTC